MSDAALNAALRRMGYDPTTAITGDGFRAMARTILHQGYRLPMKVVTGTVVKGTIRVDDPELPDGTDVFVLTRERENEVQLSSEELAELEAGIVVRNRSRLPDRRRWPTLCAQAPAPACIQEEEWWRGCFYRLWQA